MGQKYSAWERAEIARAAEFSGPEPEKCPKCGGELTAGEGYVGETLLYCGNEACDQGLVWEDGADAVRRVI